ncbi:glutathione peroxidase [Bowmanella dokdonensis]|uniref:Glutathione peroxidase n=1 Tax=Bowmanella dokdonensis TaxID=751969 RepID=A0A939DKQ8_9ALTE|nr:glutathione peroxidase [Bowmanella dokdonensis]MBN7824437.1 glutathione peroxidase [Bowmanella dokdonensis]
MTHSVHDFDMLLTNGQKQSLAEFKGKVLLIVNTASQCGFTPQYEGLEKLYQDYREKGFVVLAFPCDQFGHQEPGSDESIQEFCSLNFNLSFPLFRKTLVNGDQAAPLFEHLKTHAPGVLGSKSIKWNFTKFLIDTEGQVIKRYAPTTKPEQLRNDIESLLNKN